MPADGRGLAVSDLGLSVVHSASGYQSKSTNQQATHRAMQQSGRANTINATQPYQSQIHAISGVSNERPGVDAELTCPPMLRNIQLYVTI